MDSILYSFLLCVAVALLISPVIFWILRKIKSGQNILEYVDNHAKKQGTLSMGGLIFVLSAFSSIFFMGESRILGVLCLVVSASYALLGFLDDYLKVRYKHNEGLKPYQKIIGQVGIALIIALFIYNFGVLGGAMFVPFTNIYFDIGVFIIPFAVVFYLAVTNSVNLTDGLDGLAGYVSFIILITLGIVSLTKYNNALEMLGEVQVSTQYLNIAIACFSYSGALLVFLLFNCHPASVFMGDTGSLALGGFIATVCAFLQEYLLIAVIGICFVWSSVSDIIQVGYYKLRRKRIFLIAPYHHHLERKGMYETKIVGLYTFITLIICMITVFIYIIK